MKLDAQVLSLAILFFTKQEAITVHNYDLQFFKTLDYTIDLSSRDKHTSSPVEKLLPILI